MKKYFAIFGGTGGAVAAVVVFTIALIIPVGSMAYIHQGTPNEMKVGCGAKLATAINSVVSVPNLDNVWVWTCQRDYEDPEYPNKAKCVGKYRHDLSFDEWKTKTEAQDGTGGFGRWRPVAVNAQTQMVTVEKLFNFELDSAQMTAHAPLFNDGCIQKDDGVTNLTWPEMIRFSFFRDRVPDSRPTEYRIYVQNTYITTDTIENTAKAAMDGKALAPLVPSE